jgi:hypothetical protein
MAEGPKEGLACVSLCRKTIQSAWGEPGRQGVLLSCDAPAPLIPVFSNISPGTEFDGHVTPPTCSPSGLSPFPKKANCHVDHNHDYYGLNQKPSFRSLLDAVQLSHQSIAAANRQAGEGELLMSRFFTNNPLEIPPTRQAFIDLPVSAT